MNRRLTKQVLPIIALIFVLTLSYWIQHNQNHSVEGNKCDLDEGQCNLIYQNQSFEVEVSTLPIQVEEQSSIKIKIPADWRLDSSWIEGVNMFMGRMRILEENRVVADTNTMISGEFFLGSCTQPKMTWRIVLKLYKKGDEELPVFLEYHFTTSV